jgi:hypothetical protein
LAACVLLVLAFDAVADATPVAPSPPPALLGRSEAELREEFGAALSSDRITSRRGTAPAPTPEQVALSGSSTPGPFTDPDAADDPQSTRASKDPFAGQLRLVRQLDDTDVERVEYELFRGRVYRVRWQFSERFERPLMDSLVSDLTRDLGKPYYDQLIEAKFGSGRATLRRAAWRNGSRNLEIRQLNPLVGGPIFLSLSDEAAIREIVASGGTAAPQPDSIERWWSKPIKAPVPVTARELDALVAAFSVVRSQIAWE